ncbi:unnamed protein product [Bursaphelenchus xylophilus]|uniref:(pine wood nematode) hypothetical protein n=1 Tax=Bursaphelenchus xylophilus TaxID=6326 RepID=A0A1I7S1F3_BURXY|nr:unnamed protein product [Bursaphelenchus xylophilus]CAG9081593.1 unnamed protein product [Bursaphelenchus xylophilus]
MFPTVFSGYNTVTLVQPAFPAQPPFHPTFVLLQPIPIIFAPIQLPVQKFSPQGILDDVYGRMAEKEVYFADNSRLSNFSMLPVALLEPGIEFWILFRR